MNLSPLFLQAQPALPFSLVVVLDLERDKSRDSRPAVEQDAEKRLVAYILKGVALYRL